jgi:hypothetical protein
MIYLFDFTGQFIESGDIKTLSYKYKINKGTIYAALKRKSLVSGKFYFQNTKKFIKPIKKIGVNPMECKRFLKKGDKYKEKYTEHDKDVIKYKLLPDNQLAHMYNTTKTAIQIMRYRLLKNNQASI